MQRNYFLISCIRIFLDECSILKHEMRLIFDERNFFRKILIHFDRFFCIFAPKLSEHVSNGTFY